MILSPEQCYKQIPIRVTDCKIDFQLFWSNVSAGSYWVFFQVKMWVSPAGECWRVSTPAGLWSERGVCHRTHQTRRARPRRRIPCRSRAPPPATTSKQLSPAEPSAGRGARTFASFVLRRPFSGAEATFAALASADTHLLGNALLIQRMRSQLVSQELEHYWASLALASSLTAHLCLCTRHAPHEILQPSRLWETFQKHFKPQ